MKSRKQFTMNFESLANELLLDLFEYLDGISLLRAFFGLNSRLNQVLSYYLDFRSISKRDFDMVCQQYLPRITDRVMSLCLSDDDETPNLPEIFISRGFIFNHFIHLKSLSLYCIRSLDFLNQITIQCRHLSYLTHLNIINFYVNYVEDTTSTLMNNIWSLQLLTHCRLDNFFPGGQCFFGIRVISTSMKYLSIDNIYCDLHVLYHLFQYTPHLRRLSTASDYSSDDQPQCLTTSSINSLKLSFEGSINSLKCLFQNMPNLRYLTLKTSDIYLNGYDWEQIIVDYIPKIKLFQLIMNFHFPHCNDKEKQVDDLLNTFRTYFWLELHQWFVQCDWEPSDTFNRAILYTLPYDSGEFFYFDTIKSKSTCPIEAKYLSYDRVNILRHSFREITPVKDSIVLTPRFSKIYDLKVTIPFTDHFWACIPSLDYLHSLDVVIREDSAYSQLQSLVEQAPHLYSLTLRFLTTLEINLFQTISMSIRRLDLMTKSAFCLRYFNS